jgi:hypothetical protein
METLRNPSSTPLGFDSFRMHGSRVSSSLASDAPKKKDPSQIILVAAFQMPRGSVANHGTSPIIKIRDLDLTGPKTRKEQNI